MSLENALTGLQQRRKKAIDLNLRGIISEEELDEHLKEIHQEQQGVEQRLQELVVALDQPDVPLGPDLLEELRTRIEAGLTDAQRQEVVQHLVMRITVHTEGEKIRALIEYRFPAVVNDSRGKGSLPPPA